KMRKPRNDEKRKTGNHRARIVPPQTARARRIGTNNSRGHRGNRSNKQKADGAGYQGGSGKGCGPRHRKNYQRAGRKAPALKSFTMIAATTNNSNAQPNYRVGDERLVRVT